MSANNVRFGLLGANLGTNWILIAIAIVCSGVMMWIEPQYWKHVSIATLLGVPIVISGAFTAAHKAIAPTRVPPAIDTASRVINLRAHHRRRRLPSGC